MKPSFYRLREWIFFLLYFLYFWLFINPSLHFHRQEVAFLWGVDFFQRFLDYPGGLIEYVGSFLSSWMYSPLLGSLLFTGLAWILTWLTSILIRQLQPKTQLNFFHFLPAIFLLGLQSHYKYPLASTLALVLAVAAVVGYVRIRKLLVRILTFFVVSGLVYWIAGGAFLLFSGLCVLYELFFSKLWILALTESLWTIALPYFTFQYITLLNVSNAYFFLLPVSMGYIPKWLSYGIFCIYFLGFFLFHPRIFHFSFVKKWREASPIFQFLVSTVLLLLLVSLVAGVSFRKNEKFLLEIDRLARHQKWGKILEKAKKQSSLPLSVTFQINRALFHTHRLLDKMFSYPQMYGVSGLLLSQTFRESAPLQESDFCWDLGLINAARHWGHEAFSTDGDSPWILKRMVEVYLVVGEYKIAERFLNRLENALFLQKEAKQYRKILSSPNPNLLIEKDPLLSHGLQMYGKNDFIEFNDHPPAELDSLINQNSKNRMGIEYRIARELLSCRLAGLPQHVLLLKQVGYTSLPRHVEEALVFLSAMTRASFPWVKEFGGIRRDTFLQFVEFQRILAKYGGDKKKARPELREKFGNTYWYYTLFFRPLEKGSETPTYGGKAQ